MKYANNTLIGRIINNDESSDKEKISSLASTAINREAIGGVEQFSCSWESAFQNNRHGHHISTPVIKGKSHRWLYLRKKPELLSAGNITHWHGSRRQPISAGGDQSSSEHYWLKSTEHLWPRWGALYGDWRIVKGKAHPATVWSLCCRTTELQSSFSPLRLVNLWAHFAHSIIKALLF